jgi:RHS repeat-associated protein
LLEITNPETALIVQEEHYYGFGLGMAGLDFNAPGNAEHRYTYNGKEEVPDFGLGWLDYGARHYQADIGRWAGVDALADKYAPVSPYVYVANNPLLFVDPDGAQIIDNDGHVGRLEQEATRLRNAATASAQTLFRDIEQGLINGDNVEGLVAAFNANAENLAEYNSTLDEIATLRASSVVYNVTTNTNIDGGLTRFNRQSQRIDVIVGNTPNTIATTAHELKHAHQYENQDIAFNYGSGNAMRPVYDIQDEVVAYRRGQAFGANLGADIDAAWVRNHAPANYGNLGPRTTLASPDPTNPNRTILQSFEQNAYQNGRFFRTPHFVFRGWEAVNESGKRAQLQKIIGVLELQKK